MSGDVSAIGVSSLHLVDGRPASDLAAVHGEFGEREVAAGCVASSARCEGES
jgi:hypothetical protein